MARSWRVAVLGLALVLAIGLGGCVSSLPGGAGPDSKAVEVREQMQSEMKDVETYRVEMDIALEFEDDDRDVDMWVEGTFDRVDEKAKMTAHTRGRTVTTYIDGKMTHTGSASDGWYSQEVDEDPWEEGGGTGWESQEPILDDGNIEIAGNETFKGEAVTVLTLDVTAEEFQEAMANQQVGPTASIESVDEIEYRIYVSKETHRVRKIEMEMIADIDTPRGVKTVDYDFRIPSERRTRT